MEKTLREFLGWKCEWVLIPDEYRMILLWLPIYFPIRERLSICPKIIKRTLNGFWSGFMSESRGLSWDRKSRYGEK
jgi:hypothetical protein